VSAGVKEVVLLGLDVVFLINDPKVKGAAVEMLTKMLARERAEQKSKDTFKALQVGIDEKSVKGQH
jgi:hypothetical protein